MNSGESHLTIDEGSSNRMIRLSKLDTSASPLSNRKSPILRFRLVRTLSSFLMPLPAFLRWSRNVKLLRQLDSRALLRLLSLPYKLSHEPPSQRNTSDT